MQDNECKSNLSILIVDDNEINRKLLQLMLNRLGYRADMATNGKEAIEILEIQPYDLIFMDLQMPVFDGIRTTLAIREKLDDRERPYIIAITAYADKFDRETCKNAGMNDYLTKPATLNDIREAIRCAQMQLKNKGSDICNKRTVDDDIYR